MKILLNGDLNMRLYNIYYTCKAVYDNLKNIRAETTPTEAKRIMSWELNKQALLTLFSLDFIKEDAKAVYNVLNPIELEQSQPVIGIKTYNKLVEKNNVVLSKVTAIIDLYESIKDGSSTPGIDMKIPPCESLEDYITILRDINFVLTQCPYLKSDTEELKYKGTDVGSDWITFAIIVSGTISSGFVIFNNLASLINKAITLKSNKKILDMQEEMYKTMQMKNEATQDTIDAFNKMKELTYKQYVNELQEELGKLKDGEEEGRVSKSLEKLSTLIDKGLEIHTSIETPKEIKVLFPFVEQQQTLSDNLVKYLEDYASQNKNE